MLGMSAPDTERWSSRVVVVRGLNPGPFTGPGTNTCLIGTGDRPILLDTGSGVADYIPLLERVLREEYGASQPGEIVLTHVHPDHIGGASDVIEHFGPLSVRKKPWPELDSSFNVELTEIGDGTVIKTEGATLRAIYTPGHAPDHLCFLLEEEQALFTGDVVLGVGTTVIPVRGGDMGLYLASLERLLELNLKRIYPGHGPVIEDPMERIQSYIDHRLAREAQILEAMQAGEDTVERMVERIYVDTPRALHPAAGQSVLSHLLKLEAEKRASRAVDAGGAEHWAAS
jgi:glyoxylase-like metal-dependent hydrolase (beta-lactamase superfamily II)